MAENRSKAAKDMADWRKKNKKHHRDYMRAYCRKNKVRINEEQKRLRIKRLYGITLEQFAERLKTQGGGFAICERKAKKYRLSIDHDHITGQIRGILCAPCNRAIGTLGDSVEGLQKAINYLQII